MAAFIRKAQRTIASATFASKTIASGTQTRLAKAFSLPQLKPYATTSKTQKSPFTANILRILSNEIEYQYECTPPHEPFTSFNSFSVQDRPGEKWMTMVGKYGDEGIKIEVTMFDGCVFVPKPGEDNGGEDVVLHLSLLIDVSKGQGPPEMEFLCSAWPDRLEIHKVYLLNRDKIVTNPYIGPHYRKMNEELQETLRDYLEERGVNNELCVFLHQYMMNKDRIELIRWLGNVKAVMDI
ncbi:hypothetical protein PTKIN_Ptkin19aG0125500 [Pterospermum kingtungense]